MIRNPATKQADRILALLDNPTQSSFEDDVVPDTDVLERLADASAEAAACLRRQAAAVTAATEAYRATKPA